MTSPLSLSALLDLFFKPSRFFTRGTQLLKRPEIVIVAWIAGLSLAFDRTDLNMILADVGIRNMPGSAHSWPRYWTVILVIGTFAAWVAWYAGGWWYRVRLQWSGALQPDHRLARAVNVYQTFVDTAPFIVVALIETVVYRNYAQDWDSLDYWQLPFVVFIFLSYRTSYVAATTAFATSRKRAAFWFIAFPLMFYTVVLMVFGVLYAIHIDE